jgi:hypothetical protein
MSVMRLILGLLCGIVFLLCAVGNAVLAVRWMTKQRSGSSIPLAGGIAGMFAVLLLPWPSVKSLWWAPLVLDIGSGPLVMWGIGKLAARLVRRA